MIRQIFTILLFLAAFGTRVQAAGNTNIAKIDSGKVYTTVELKPEFPGGPDALREFLVKNIQYPATAMQNKTVGKVLVNFVVEKDGSLSNFKIIRGVSKELNAEALRVLSTSPKWTPGQQNHEIVRSAVMIPVKFSIK